MFGLKIILTIIITLMIVLGFLSTSPTVGGFFENVMDRLSGITVFEADNTQRTISFSLVADRFDIITMKTRRLINITIHPENISLSLKNGIMKPEKAFVLQDFRGQMSVSEHKITLDGSYEKIEFIDKSLSLGGGTVKTDGAYSNLTVEGMGLNELKLTNATGKIISSEIETAFAGTEVNIKYPLGIFNFDNKIKIDGSASKISIPSRNLNIG